MAQLDDTVIGVVTQKHGETYKVRVPSPLPAPPLPGLAAAGCPPPPATSMRGAMPPSTPTHTALPVAGAVCDAAADGKRRAKVTRLF